MALKRNRANLFQTHNDFSFEGHVGAAYYGEHLRLRAGQPSRRRLTGLILVTIRLIRSL